MSKMRVVQFTKAVVPLEKYMIINAEVDRPTAAKLKPAEVLVEVYAAALNPADYKLPEVPFVGRFIAPAPAEICHDFAGKVIAVGSARDDLKPGDMCFGQLPNMSGHGTLAEHIVATGPLVAKLPPGVDVDQAAGVGVAAHTAYASIIPHIRSLPPGARVFINGGSGGTGTFGIQIAKALGCHVTTSCSAANAQLCRELGADEVIDYRSEDVATALAAKSEKFDLCVDNVGTPLDLYARCHTFLKEGAPFMQVGAEVSLSALRSILSRALLPAFLGGGQRKWAMVSIAGVPKKGPFEEIAEWMAKGQVKTVIADKFDLEDTQSAFKSLRTGRTRGKIIVGVKQT